MQFKRLVEQHQQRLKQPQGPGVIATKDLLTVIDAYEHEHDVLLLTSSQKKAIHPYTLNTPDLEMTPDDILNLLKLVFTPPSPVTSLSAPTSKLSALPRTSAPLKPTSSSNITTGASASTWKRRLSTASMHSTVAPFDFMPIASSPVSKCKPTFLFLPLLYSYPLLPLFVFYSERISHSFIWSPSFLGSGWKAWTRAIVSRYNARGSIKSTPDIKSGRRSNW